jgi:hypothetical protein
MRFVDHCKLKRLDISNIKSDNIVEGFVREIMRGERKYKMNGSERDEHTSKDSKKVSRNRINVYCERFVEALLEHGPLSHAHGKWKEDLKLEDYGTSLWTVNLMKELNLDTNCVETIESFERDLTNYILKPKT